MIGALHELNPVLTRQGDDDAECLSVAVTVEKNRLLIVAGYGPQLGDPLERKTAFWKYLDEEVKSAKEIDSGIIIQMDSNSWSGADIIPLDPNKQNSNGKLFKNFLDRNPELTVVNSLGCCEGSITRQRTTILGVERSILDVYIVCRKVLGLIKHMKIDHEGIYSLSNYNSKRTVGKVTTSDHHPIILTLDLSIPPGKIVRTSNFNLKDKEGQQRFFHMTDKTSEFTDAITTPGTFKNQVAKWEKLVEKIISPGFS